MSSRSLGRAPTGRSVAVSRSEGGLADSAVRPGRGARCAGHASRLVVQAVATHRGRGETGTGSNGCRAWRRACWRQESPPGEAFAGADCLLDEVRSALAEALGPAHRAGMTTARSRLISTMLRRALGRRLGRAAADRIASDADKRYLPPPLLARTGSGQFNLRMAAYLLALRDALTAAGRSAAEAQELLAEALFCTNRRLNHPLDAAVHLLHPIDWSARIALREKISRRLFFPPPDWVMEDVPDPDGFAYDVQHCVFADYLRGRGEGAFCQQVLCAQDFRMAQKLGEVLQRTGTLAGGAPRCDFRYRHQAMRLTAG